jgi:hypothetical protein
VTEDEFQSAVIELAQRLGWLVAHFRPARTEHGWRTAVSGDGLGFPDLVLVRNTRLLFVELKSERGRVRPEPALWLAALEVVAAAARGAVAAVDPGVAPNVAGLAVAVHVWRPSDWPAVERELKAA